jgi:hypothetical protein
VLILNEGARSQAQVDAQARRERSKRSMKKDAYEITIDGWSYWDGANAIPWGINTTADVDVDVIGGPQGLYYGNPTRNGVVWGLLGGRAG